MDGSQPVAGSFGPVAASRFGRLPAGRAPLYQALADQIAKVVKRLRLPPGTQLPTEDQLARHFGVSMITVRGALRELQQRGLIERRQGRGTFVGEPPQPAPEWGLGSIDDIQATNRLAELRLLRNQRDPVPDWAAEPLGLARGEAGLHLRIVRSRDGAPFMLQDAFYPEAIGALLAGQPLDALLQRNRLLVEVAEGLTGERMTDIHQAMSAVRATAEVARLLEVRAGEPLLAVTRVNYAQSGGILQVTRSLYRTDAATYTMHLKRS